MLLNLFYLIILKSPDWAKELQFDSGFLANNDVDLAIYILIINIFILI